MRSEIQIDKHALKRALTIGIALVWFLNGLFCKLLNLVPRHQMIVFRILGEDYAYVITKTIGLLELLMVVWILSRIKPALCALTQMLVVAAMVIIESMLAPDLLLFGKANLIPAAVFISVVYLNEFLINRMGKSKSFQKV